MLFFANVKSGSVNRFLLVMRPSPDSSLIFSSSFSLVFFASFFLNFCCCRQDLTLTSSPCLAVNFLSKSSRGASATGDLLEDLSSNELGLRRGVEDVRNRVSPFWTLSEYRTPR